MPTPSEQLLTRTVYATDGVTANWDFSFSGGYLDKSHVKAFTEATTGERIEIIVTEAMLVGPFQVRIAPALAAGLTLTLYRDTPKDLPLVDFTDESGFSEIALDTNAKQAVFIAAETTDTVNTSSSYDAEQAASLAAIAAAAAQVGANAAAASALLAANEADASAASAVLSAASAANSANSAASSSAAATTVFNANTTAYTRTLLDDANAAAARTTLGAAASGPLATSGITGAAASGANTDITSITGNAATATTATIAEACSGNAATATTDNQHFCVGQTLTGLTGSRALGTTYTNSTGKPIYVIVNSTSAQGINYNITAFINGAGFAIAGGYSASGVQYHNLSFPVPNGATYSVALSGGGSLSSWSEIR